jgi:hypothetical protein
MFYRRKIILELLNTFGGELKEKRFYQLLFLLSTRQDDFDFHFVPLSGSPFSFLAEKDISVMKKYGYLADSDNVKIKTMPPDADVSEDMLAVIKLLKKAYGKYSPKYLSGLIDIILPKYSRRIYLESITKSSASEKTPNTQVKKMIYSLGYEGKDIDQYLNILIENKVTLLCDVRKNPLSMKFGFSKSQLKSYCEKLNIAYLHFPEFGIESGKRKNLEEESDYKILFKDYEKNTLPLKTKEIENLLSVISNYNKIAFTCFESDPGMCHRSHLLNFVFRNYHPDYKLMHI